MAYDEELAGRIRELVASEDGLTEQKMFGGLAFLIGGNLAVAASGQGGILVRVEPDESEALVARTEGHAMEMRGREMRGWIRVDAARAHETRARGMGPPRDLVRPLAASQALGTTIDLREDTGLDPWFSPIPPVGRAPTMQAR